MPTQLKRLLIVFTAIVCLFLVARHFLVPASFGKYGHYRANALDEIKKQEPKYVGATVCQGCHDDIFAKKANSKHATVTCETCHGVGAEHVKDPMSVKLDKPHEREFCGECHSKNFARSKGMPQIDLESHNVGMDCFLCHNAHEPKK